MGKNDWNNIVLSDEQKLFIDTALEGHNILVDACIGSGKTTAIQYLCNVIDVEKKVLYLTYNRLLKMDARKRIKQKNVMVTNYHGFAYSMLKSAGLDASVQDMIQVFLNEGIPAPHFDVLIIDEYQDIEQEFADELQVIKNNNPEIQIIAVGDMDQKIYDKTTLNVIEFIQSFLEDYKQLTFTNCFRLSSDLATSLGNVWQKSINGINDACMVEVMSENDVRLFLAEQEPKDVLCLGSRRGAMAHTLNWLEDNCPETWNKKTVFASISDRDATGVTQPKASSAIFTTYDSSKGMERKICVVFDFTESYWAFRLSQPQQKYEILRNIFCVAASRGKEHIIFVDSAEQLLSEETLLCPEETNDKFVDIDISKMFDFKYVEDIEKCYSLLNVERIEDADTAIIAVKNHDEMIDLSPCVGIFQEAYFFDAFDIDSAIEFYFLMNRKDKKPDQKELNKMTVEEKILWLTSLETSQDRYRKQVTLPFVDEDAKKRIEARLETMFSHDENVQKHCAIPFSDRPNGRTLFSAIGMVDVYKNDIVYELKFVSELQHTHFLQCACYMVAMGLKEGIVWNTRDNKKYKINIPDEKAFLDAVAVTITKRELKQYCKPVDEAIAIIDTETNFGDEVMSIGVVVANARSLEETDCKYFIIDEAAASGGMYSVCLKRTNEKAIHCTRKDAIDQIIEWLNSLNVNRFYAYNAGFDYLHLPELAARYAWYDIMRLAAYKQYNRAIPHDADCYSTGKLKRGYRVEDIYRMLDCCDYYFEVHNAVEDARDELYIMKKLEQPLAYYELGRIGGQQKQTQTQQKKARQSVKKHTVSKDVEYVVGEKVFYRGLGEGIVVEIIHKPPKDLLVIQFPKCSKKALVDDSWLEKINKDASLKREDKPPKRKTETEKLTRKEAFEKKVAEKSHNSIRAMNYTNSRERVDAECLICGHRWSTRADHLLERCRCSRCKSVNWQSLTANKQPEQSDKKRTIKRVIAVVRK